LDITNCIPQLISSDKVAEQMC